MKKLLLASIVATVVVAANGASYNWETNLGDGYDGMTWYVINGSGASTLVDMLAVDGDTAAFTAAIAAYGSNVQSGTFEAGWAGWQDGSFSDAASTAFLFVIDSLDEGSTFYYSAEISTADYAYEPPAGASGTLTFDTVSSGTIASIPEPTSGLLMLLGMAGLALRRHRA